MLKQGPQAARLEGLASYIVGKKVFSVFEDLIDFSFFSLF